MPKNENLGSSVKYFDDHLPMNPPGPEGGCGTALLLGQDLHRRVARVKWDQSETSAHGQRQAHSGSTIPSQDGSDLGRDNKR